MPQVHGDIEGTPDEVWRRGGVPAPVYASRAWLGGCRWPGDGTRYLVEGSSLLPLREVTDPHAWPAMNLVDICAGTGYDVPIGAEVLERARAAATPHLLVATPGYFTVVAGATDGASVAGVVDAAIGHARRRGLPIGFGYLPAEADDVLAVLRERGFADGLVSVNTRLDLPGERFSDYLADRPSRRRVTIRRERRIFAEAGGTITVSSGWQASEQLAAVGELEAEVQRHHGFTADPETYARQHRRLLELFGERMVVLRADLAGEPVGTATVFHGADELVGRTIGLRDRADVRAAMVYFNLCYYATIALAYQLGVRRVYFGPSTLQAKTYRGARLVPLRAAVGPGCPPELVDMLRRTDDRIGELLRGYGRASSL